MNRLPTRFAIGLAAIALISAIPAHAARPVRKAAPAAAPAASNAIIPLPLQPVVPAGQRVCAAKSASGLGFTVLKPGTGPKAGPTDFALVNYIGYIAATGAVFDQNQSAPLQADGVIPGFGEGLGMIQRGAIYRLCIPSALGYGPAASGPIPANSDLVFQVELLDSRTAAEVEAMRKQYGEAQGAPEAAPKP